jgi:probable phosphoglycerate mutase
MVERFRAAIDGGSRGNPGPAAWGVAILDDDGACVSGHHGTLGRATNNVAEWRSLIEALELARRQGAKQVDIQADSELVVKQFNGRYKVKHPDLKPFFEAAMRLKQDFDAVRLRHVRREYNKHADRLVNEALDAAADSPGGS